MPVFVWVRVSDFGVPLPSFTILSSSGLASTSSPGARLRGAQAAAAACGAGAQATAAAADHLLRLRGAGGWRREAGVVCSS